MGIGDRECCFTCEEQLRQKLLQEGGALIFPIIIVCSSCGNKRCPKATHHDNACTGSNKPGQEGSVYGDTRIPPCRGHGEMVDAEDNNPS